MLLVGDAMKIETGKGSVLGEGPVLVGAMAVLSIVFLIMNKYGVFNFFVAEKQNFARLFTLGGLLLAAGVYLWLMSVVCSDITNYIKQGKLYTDSVYTWCRNPIYTAWYFIILGILFILTANYFVFVLAFVFWGWMTFCIRRTEEVWMYEEFGDEFVDYCRKVNRFMPVPSISGVNYSAQIINPEEKEDINSIIDEIEEDLSEVEDVVHFGEELKDELLEIDVLDEIVEEEISEDEVVDLTADIEDEQEVS